MDKREFIQLYVLLRLSGAGSSPVGSSLQSLVDYAAKTYESVDESIRWISRGPRSQTEPVPRGES